MVDKSYKANGKLLLTSEYLIKDGAEGLCLPAKFGQRLNVQAHSGTGHEWSSVDADNNIWFNAKFTFDFEILDTSDEEKALWLSGLLKKAHSLGTVSFKEAARFETILEFPNNWGLGSSSTLICLVAKAFDCDPFQLHFSVSNGSGYDIACGDASGPIKYAVNEQNVKVSSLNFNPSFKENIYFIHLNKKQVSSREVNRYDDLKKELDMPSLVNLFTDLTEGVSNVEDQKDFERMIVEHEKLMSHILERSTIHESLFSDYSKGVIKSLGAWGGDFFLVTVQDAADLEFFRKKGYETIISYEDMII